MAPDPWAQSLRAVGGIIVLIASIAGIAITPEDQQTIDATILHVSAALGGGLAIYSKFKEWRQK